MLKFVVQTGSKQRIRIKVYDPKNANTVYTDRYDDFIGKKAFYVKMPLSPDVAVIKIYNERNGDLPKGQDKSFAVLESEALPLPTKIEGLAGMNPDVYDWIKFCKEFSEQAGYLGTGTYFSDSGKFRIDYFPVIKNDKGKAIATPARISTNDGIIQVSQHHFRNYTIPKRFAILCHEYSHFYENNNMRDEVEADLNGILIYLGLGFPKIECHQAFLDVFKGTPTELNKHRYNVLKQFIDKFEDISFTLIPNDARKK